MARVSVTLLAAGVAATIACNDRSASTAPGGGPAVIRGSITSAKTSAGIANLVAALLQDGQIVRTTPTGSDGVFEFRDVPAGSYVVRLTGFELAGVSMRHTAFTPAEDTVNVADRPVELFFAAVGLIPPRIVGYVRCGGAVVPDARVRVVGGERDEIVATNPQGKYGVTDLEPGSYAVILVAAPCEPNPAYGTARLQPGQAVEVNFDG